jgi:hypothetical protein
MQVLVLARSEQQSQLWPSAASNAARKSQQA